MWKNKVITFARPLLVKLKLQIVTIQGYVVLLEMRACDLGYTFNASDFGITAFNA